MRTTPENAVEEDFATRVLVLAPTQRDAEITRNLIAQNGTPSLVCESVPMLLREMARGAGALLVTEEIFRSEGIENLLAALASQPSWSDIPVIILLRGGTNNSITSESLVALRNVTLLDRPTSMRSLASAVQVAVRGRLRQYQIRDQIQEIQRNQHEREILLDSERAARTEAERANRVKDEFLATVSHELRTPLNAILGWAQILVRSPNNAAEVLEGMEIIERNAMLQAQLIEELLDTSRIISGKLRLDLRPIDPAGIIESAIASVQPSADEKGVHIQKNIDTMGTISGDSSRVQQILWNLLSNAVKFTPSGGKVIVTARRLNGSLEIQVADTGKGLSPDFVPHVFERFRQADGTTTRSHGGLGLGLAIVKHLVELHGGTARAESPGENRGTTFVITFPVIGEPAPRVDPTRLVVPNDHCGQVDLTGVRVLVVDDDADARRLTKRLLVECKADVLSAASAQEALESVAAFKPTVLVSDIGMPEMDGYQFIQRVRGMGVSADSLPAVAVTAFARAEDRHRALLAGYQNHLPKPVAPAQLLAIVASLAHRNGPSVQGSVGNGG